MEEAMIPIPPMDLLKACLIGFSWHRVEAHQDEVKECHIEILDFTQHVFLDNTQGGPV